MIKMYRLFSSAASFCQCININDNISSISPFYILQFKINIKYRLEPLVCAISKLIF